MLADKQSELLNAADLARALAVDGKTIARTLDLLVDLLLVRRLQPWHRNEGKRLVKSPKAERGFTQACMDLNPTRCFVVYGGTERFPLNRGTEAIGLSELATRLQKLG